MSEGDEAKFAREADPRTAWMHALGAGALLLLPVAALVLPATMAEHDTQGEVVAAEVMLAVALVGSPFFFFARLRARAVVAREKARLAAAKVDLDGWFAKFSADWGHDDGFGAVELRVVLAEPIQDLAFAEDAIADIAPSSRLRVERGFGPEADGPAGELTVVSPHHARGREAHAWAVLVVEKFLPTLAAKTKITSVHVA